MLRCMSRDIIDDLQEDWSEERPDLDSEAMGVVLRIQALDKILGDQVAERLRDFGLQWWQYDVLSALRRQGKPFRMAATELAECRQADVRRHDQPHRPPREQGTGPATARPRRTGGACWWN